MIGENQGLVFLRVAVLHRFYWSLRKVDFYAIQVMVANNKGADQTARIMLACIKVKF